MGGVGVSEACHFLFCAPLSCASIDADHIIAMRAFHGQRDLPTMALIAERAQREGLVCNLTMEEWGNAYHDMVMSDFSDYPYFECPKCRKSIICWSMGNDDYLLTFVGSLQGATRSRPAPPAYYGGPVRIDPRRVKMVVTVEKGVPSLAGAGAAADGSAAVAQPGEGCAW